MHMLENEELSIEEKGRLTGYDTEVDLRETVKGKTQRLVGALVLLVIAVLLVLNVPSYIEAITGNRERIGSYPFWIVVPVRLSELLIGMDFAARIAQSNALGLWGIPISLFLVVIQGGLTLIVFLSPLWICPIALSAGLNLLASVGFHRVESGYQILKGIGIHLDKDSKKQFGKEGERITEEQLARLPDDYHVFGNLQFEYENHEGKRRPAEADFLVVGPTGLHLVEVKNWTGSIEQGSKSQTVRHKKVKGNGIEEKSPFLQACRNAGNLGGLIRAYYEGRAFINANVFFVDDRLEVRVPAPENCGVFKGKEQLVHHMLTDSIRAPRGTALTSEQILRIVDIIEKRIWTPRYSEEVMHYLKGHH